jgi:murein DD-endopeptidase MepM/ murein hydrolase activator NlpD
MFAGVVWSGLGRCALLSTAMSMLLFTGGCSSGSRFDFPAFNLTGSSEADPQTTASVPVPRESIYDGAYGRGGHYGQSGRYAQYSRSTLPPPRGYSAGVVPASYSPEDDGLRAETAAYTPPRAAPAMPRSSGAGSQTIKVSEGDSLYGLARRYGVSVRAIKDANGLEEGRIRIGQKLIIPSGGRAAPVSTATTYKVRSGDTPRSIAAKLGVSERALIARNDLNPARLRIGQVLKVPEPGHKAPEGSTRIASYEPSDASTASDSRPVKTTAVSPPALPDDAGDAPGAAETGPGAIKPVAAEVTGPSESQFAKEAQPAQIASMDRLPSPEPMAGNSFRWPVQGRIVSAFGARPSGGNNDGIDIAVPLGTPVKAAENGVVAYAGDELKGYGNLVLIRHANNWVSAYAHNDEIMVKRGEQVRRGQIISKAGRSGQASQPQLHFELRKGSRPIDPTKYMTSAQANAD